MQRLVRSSSDYRRPLATCLLGMISAKLESSDNISLCDDNNTTAAAGFKDYHQHADPTGFISAQRHFTTIEKKNPKKNNTSSSIAKDTTTTTATTRRPHYIKRKSSLVVVNDDYDDRSNPEEKMKVEYAMEIGEESRRRLLPESSSSSSSPFSREIVGIYTQHGIESVLHYTVLDPLKNSSSNGKLSMIRRETSKINQDRGSVAYPYGGMKNTALFAVYDGHGHDGEHVSEFVMHDIQDKLYKHSEFQTNKVQAFRDTFTKVEKRLENIFQPLYSGTTACIVLLSGNQLHISNLGDCRAVLGQANTATTSDNNSNDDDDRTTTKTISNDNNNYTAKNLTCDQKPDCPNEKNRLENCGGYVSPSVAPGFPARVWLDRTLTKLGLAVSRSLGDVALKHVGVISDPVVTTYEIQQNDNDDDLFLILATDGVWEHIDSNEAVRLVGRAFDSGKTADEACRQLIQESMARWAKIDGTYRDDITVIIVKLENIWKNV